MTVQKPNPVKGNFVVSALKVPLTRFLYGLVAFVVAVVMSVLSSLRHIRCGCSCSGKHIDAKEERAFLKPVHYKKMPQKLEAPYAVYPSLYLDASPAVRKRLDRLEEKVTLLSKSQESHIPREAFLDASLERVRSLETELAETRKTLRAVLEKQTELYNCLEQFKEMKWKRRMSCW